MRFKLHQRKDTARFLVIAAAICGFAQLAVVHAEAQNTYYVATNGSDSNNGSLNSPWATPQHSSRVAQPGDTVIVEDGTYDVGSSGGTGDWRIANGGTSGHPVTYMAQHKWQAKLVGHGSGDGTTAIGLAGGYTIIRDFDITGSDANAINLTTDGTAASYNQVVDNYIHDMVTPCDGNSGAGVTSGSGGNNYAGVGHESVVGNLIVNLLAAGGCPGGHQASGVAMMLPYGVVANNVVINCGDAIEAWHAATNEVFFGNVVINSGRGLSMGAGDSPGGVTDNNSLVQNNIVVNGSGPAIIETGGTGTNNLYKDNLVYGGDTSIQLSNGLSATGTIDADPQFVNNTGTAAGDYRLQTSSPARGSGLALAGVANDFLGNPRPQSGATDIGACLFISASSDLTPTASINSSATSVTAGGAATMSWTTTNAASATLNGQPVATNSSATVNPASTTTYTLVATSSSGATATNSVTITVTSSTPTTSSGPVAAGISASSTSITSGASTTLTWSSQNAVSGSINGTPVPLSGTASVRPTATTTYRFTAVNSSNATDWGQVTITVTAPTTGPVAAGIKASNTSISKGQSSVLSWTTANAVSASLNGTPVATSGSVAVQPTSTTTYRITATGSNGTTDWGSVTITVY